MRKNVIVLALVTIVGITISYAQTNIMGIAPRQANKKEKLSNLMKKRVVGWNCVDEGGKWYKWGNVDPIYEFKIFADLYAEPTELYEQDIPTKVYAGSVFIGKNLLAITSTLESFNKAITSDDKRVFSTTSYRNSVDIKTERYWFSYADLQNSYRHKVYIDDTDIITELFDFLKGPKSEIRFRTLDLHLKNGFKVQSIPSSIMSEDMAIYSYNYYDIRTEELEESPKAPNGNKDLAKFIQNQIKKLEGWEDGFTCSVKARFIIEKDGSVSDLILEGGDFFAREYKDEQYRWYYAPEWITDSKIEGFNNQVAKIINSTKFIPGKKGGKSVRTCCEYSISYKVPNTTTSNVTPSSNPQKTKSSISGTDNLYNYDELDVKPSYPGGEIEMLTFIGKHVKYPNTAYESGIQGRVFVSFIVEADGAISNVEVVRGIGGGCDEEAVRVVKSMPQWLPGEYQRKPVRVRLLIPISFMIR